MEFNIPITELFMLHLGISIVSGALVFGLIQKMKELPFIDKPIYLWLLNLIFSIISYPFSIFYYETDKIGSLWIILYTFIGAEVIYTVLKKQNLINYTPKKLSDTIEVEKEEPKPLKEPSEPLKEEPVSNEQPKPIEIPTPEPIKPETKPEPVIIPQMEVVEPPKPVEVVKPDENNYVSRLTEPSYDSPFWIHTTKGGLNSCILIGGNSVLPNCVGYAWGRFYELLGSKPNLARTNAEKWFSYNDGYARGNTPKLGAVACWQKGPTLDGSDGAGHVAIVEAINPDGTITLSNSGYGGKRFYVTTMKAPYSLGGTYKFQGFIYNPATENLKQTEIKSNVPITYTVKKGDTLSKIAIKFYGSGEKEYYMFIAQTNNINNPSIISVGQQLIILPFIK